MKILSYPYRLYKFKIIDKIPENVRGRVRLYKILRKIAELGIPKVSEDQAESIFEKEWDNLIILDACRYDYYKEIYPEADSRISLGSSTKEYIEKNYSEGDYSDIVYVTGNPHFYSEIFQDITGKSLENVFHSVYNTYETKWDEDGGVVLPESIVEDSMSAKKLFPDKRKIIHFMQPHTPYTTIGDDAPNVINHRNETKKKEFGEIDLDMLRKAFRGEMGRERVIDGYKSNLEYVLTFVDEIEDKLEGKTVITADHGELLGENGLYEHPSSSKLKHLRQVPWDVRE